MPKACPLPSKNAILSVVHYDEDTGLFKRVQFNKFQPWLYGTIITPPKGKRVEITIDGQRYQGSRIAWFLHYGDDPLDQFVDHIDRDIHNNRISNLRLATCAENSRNRIQHFDYSLRPYTGVIQTRSGKWRGSVTYNRKSYSTRRFLTPEEANQARTILRDNLFGEFTPV